MSTEWASATATFTPVANYDDGTVERLTLKNFRETGATSFGMALSDGSAEVVVFGTPAEMAEFGRRFTAFAEKVASQLVETQYDRQRAEHDCGDPLCQGMPDLSIVKRDA